MTTKPAETADTMKARIRAHHRGDPRLSVPEWAVMTEVASSTGGPAVRYADAVAMNLWPSRGLAIHGFEIKISRADWLRELKDPGKAELIQGYCDYWWVVTLDGVVMPGELPDGWGLMVPNQGARLRVVTQARKVAEPKPVGRSFIASLLRRAVQQSPDKLAVEAAVAEERRGAAERLQVALRSTRDDRDRATGIIGRFGVLTGIRLEAWQPDEHYAEIGAVVKAAMDGRRLDTNTRERTRHMVDELRLIAARLEATVAGEPGEGTRPW